MEDDAPPGVPEWVVTYGDMMSLLLTFFIMLVSLSEVKANAKYRAVLESLQKHVGYRAGPIVPPGDYFPGNSMVDGPHYLGAFSKTGKGKGGIKAPQTPEGDDMRVYMPRHAQSVPAGEPILFDPFFATPNGEIAAQMTLMVRLLEGKPNKIELCGHTSSRPLPEGNPHRSLLALSYARGRFIYEQLVAQGIERERIRIVAYADHAPLPASHDAHELNEDRVEIQILDSRSEDYRGRREGE
jgi:chemotaxis protein MotB